MRRRTPLYLASASPRRLELLRQIGLAPRVCPVDVDETVRDGEPPHELVLRLARLKAHAAGERLAPRSAAGVVLGADTEVVLDGAILGKPRDAADAERMLRRLRGRAHEVLTGVCLLRTDDRRSSGGVDRTRVLFRDYDERTLAAYAASPEPRDKAGGYAIQGRGALLGAGLEGSWSNVVGLPLERLPGWLAELGFDLTAWIDWDPTSRRGSGRRRRPAGR
ncbi:MAG TPA: Maf family protein [Candidatus Polarisedimenticolaceae bacterium]|nr:Maf family protein [Candidatus Polarisedimenticolaceae bacterium]